MSWASTAHAIDQRLHAMDRFGRGHAGEIDQLEVAAGLLADRSGILDLDHRRQRRCRERRCPGPRLPCRLVGLLDRRVDIQRIEHACDHVAAVEALLELRGGEVVGRLVVAVVDLPADQIVGPGRGVIVALRRPGDPALAVRVHEQRQKLGAVADPVPADGAVAIGGDDQPAVRRDVDPPAAGTGRGSRQTSLPPASNSRSDQSAPRTNRSVPGTSATLRLVSSCLQDEFLAVQLRGELFTQSVTLMRSDPVVGGQRFVLGRIDRDGPARERKAQHTARRMVGDLNRPRIGADPQV